MKQLKLGPLISLYTNDFRVIYTKRLKRNLSDSTKIENGTKSAYSIGYRILGTNIRHRRYRGRHRNSIIYGIKQDRGSRDFSRIIAIRKILRVPDQIQTIERTPTVF
jgi:hypothetical protein